MSVNSSLEFRTEGEYIPTKKFIEDFMVFHENGKDRQTKSIVYVLKYRKKPIYTIVWNLDRSERVRNVCKSRENCR